MRAIFAMFFVGAVAGAPLHATTVLPADLGQLSRDAVAIVRGQVISLDARWTDDHRGLETLITLKVDAYLKGSLGTSVTFQVPGGRLGRFQSVMVGAPTFSRGQRVIVFLGAHGPRVPHVLGLNQGVFQLAAATSGWVVTPPAVMPANARVAITRGDVSRRPLPLASFERQVRVLAGTAR